MLILAQRVIHAFLSLIYYPAIDYYGVPVPPLTLISATLFLIGLGLCLFYTRKINYLILNGYFWGFMFAVGVFAIPPSADTYHMLTAFPAAVLMAAIGLDAIMNLIGVLGKSTYGLCFYYIFRADQLDGDQPLDLFRSICRALHVFR